MSQAPEERESANVAKALRALLTILHDARGDEEADASSTSGGYLFGDVLSEAIEDAENALTSSGAA